MPSVGVLKLFVHLGDLQVRVWFGGIDQLSVTDILGISFLYGFGKVVLPQERRIIPRNSRPIASLSTCSYDGATSTTIDEYNIPTVTETPDNSLSIR